MGGRLILARKVKVNIRYLVAFKAEEGFKRNIKAVLLHLRAAFWTILVGHIYSDIVFAVFKKYRMFAFGADIMRT